MAASEDLVPGVKPRMLARVWSKPIKLSEAHITFSFSLL